jgi:phage FluMu protein Com
MVMISTMTNEIQNPAEHQIQDQFLLFIDYNYACLCRECGVKVLDPDKIKGQVYLRGKCPTCNQISADPQTRQSKREKRANKKELKRQAKLARMLGK